MTSSENNFDSGKIEDIRFFLDGGFHFSTVSIDKASRLATPSFHVRT